MEVAKIVDHSDKYMKEVEDALEVALTALGIHISGEAQEELGNSPIRIDTGLLRNSITYALDGEPPNTSTYSGDNPSKYTGKPAETGHYSGTAPKEGNNGRSVIIGTNVNYAIYVHEGTSRMSPNRFLKNAVDRNQDQISAKLKEALGG